MKFFNTAGPCKPDMHYMLPASTRLPELRRLIDQQSYFVIHAPRQVGKHTAQRCFGPSHMLEFHALCQRHLQSHAACGQIDKSPPGSHGSIR